MAAATAGIAGIAVVALGATAQNAVTVGSSPAPKPAATLWRVLGLNPISFQAPAITVGSQPKSFETERGDTIQLTAVGHQSLPIHISLVDGTSAPRPVALTQVPIGVVAVRETATPGNGRRLYIAASDAKAALVRTTHGLLVLGISTEILNQAAVEPSDAAKGTQFRGKHITGAQKAVVFWTYLPDGKNPTQATLSLFYSGIGPARPNQETAWAVVSTKVKLTLVTDPDAGGSAHPSGTPSSTPSTDPSSSTPPASPSGPPPRDPTVAQPPGFGSN
jgi:hypothetical protein